MQDRVPLYPGRVTLTPVSGNTYDMAMADQPQVTGTPLNKANLLSDAAAAAVWPVAADRPADPVPSDAFAALGAKGQFVLADYTTTTVLSSSNPETFTLADDIANYKMIDIWQYGNVSSAKTIVADVGSAISDNSRIASFDTIASGNYSCRAECLLLDNASTGHVVITTQIQRYLSGTTVKIGNQVYSGTGKLSGTSITLSTTGSGNIGSTGIRFLVIGTRL